MKIKNVKAKNNTKMSMGGGVSTILIFTSALFLTACGFNEPLAPFIEDNVLRTVTFYDDNDIIINDPIRDSISRIKSPLTKPGYKAIWWIDKDEEIEWDGSFIEKKEYHLYLKKLELTLNVSDRGPGGGIIFYVADGQGGRPLGFKMADTDEICYYLEAAPDDIIGLYWASGPTSNINQLISGLSQTSSDQTDKAIGRGRLNTAIIIAHGIENDYTTPVASACIALTQGGQTDWFLPSESEFRALYQNRDDSSIFESFNSGATYITSSQYNANAPVGVYNNTWAGGSKTTNNARFRPIRAF